MSAGAVDRGLEPECRVRLYADAHERVKVALTPLPGRRDVVGAEKHSDAPMAQRQQMLDQEPGAADPVGLDEVTLEARHRAVDEHEGE